MLVRNSPFEFNYEVEPKICGRHGMESDCDTTNAVYEPSETIVAPRTFLSSELGSHESNCGSRSSTLHTNTHLKWMSPRRLWR